MFAANMPKSQPRNPLLPLYPVIPAKAGIQKGAADANDAPKTAANARLRLAAQSPSP